MAIITDEQVTAAYAALATGQRDRIAEIWAEDLRWLVPGHNPLSGWKNNLDEFTAFMATVGRLSDHSFRMDRVALMVADNFSADVTRNTGHRAGQPDRRLDIDVIHWLSWRDGKVVEGRGAIFGDGTAQYDAFWARDDAAGTTHEVIARYYETAQRGAWEQWLTLFAPDVSGDEQLAGHFEGIEVLQGAIGAISYGYGKFQMIPKEVVVDGEQAAVVWRCDATNRAGTPIAYNYLPDREVVGANFFRLENGKIKYMRTIHDETAFAPFNHPTNPKAPPA